MSKMKHFLLLLLLLTIVGCTQNSKEKELSDRIQLDMVDTLYQIAEKSNFDTVFEVTEDHLGDRYGWDLNNGIEVSGLFGSILDTNRTLIFHVKTSEDKQLVYDFIEHLKQEIKESYTEEMLNEKDIIDQSISLDEGTYILFITGNNAQDGAKYFEDICK